jgi:putative selenate reductase molybdopterin-binding subunit
VNVEINLTINGEEKVLVIKPNLLLMDLLRRERYFSVKHGCETGDCGACAVLLDGRAVNTCIMLAAQAHEKSIVTLESLGTPDRLHPLQQAFIESGAIQCGYCTPAMILVAKALLDANPNPTETEVRQALAGVLCRCTGYVKPVEAVLAAAKHGR